MGNKSILRIGGSYNDRRYQKWGWLGRYHPPPPPPSKAPPHPFLPSPPLNLQIVQSPPPRQVKITTPSKVKMATSLSPVPPTPTPTRWGWGWGVHTMQKEGKYQEKWTWGVTFSFERRNLKVHTYYIKYILRPITSNLQLFAWFTLHFFLFLLFCRINECRSISNRLSWKSQGQFAKTFSLAFYGEHQYHLRTYKQLVPASQRHQCARVTY